MAAQKAIRLWILSIAVLIFILVSIGGATRLTGSGLSITEWKPIMGAIPPLHATDWNTAFEKYKAIPQYQQINAGMSLSQFKFIFFWEYFHRLVARLIGFVVLVPGLYFYFKKKLSRELTKKMIIGFCLGGLQGFMGWFMVKSGLIDRVSVSHYRLAAHLSLALILLSYFIWIYRSLKPDHTPDRKVSKALYWALPLLALQIIYGAFVAGLRAGFGFNTFPKMLDHWVPPHFFTNFLENHATTQWIHRWLAMIVLVVLLRAAWLSIKNKNAVTRFWGIQLAIGVFAQVVLGILTLIYVVPIPLAVLHQSGAAWLVIILTHLWYLTKRAS